VEEKEISKMMRYTKRELVEMLEALARGIDEEQGVNTLCRLAFRHTKERAEKAEAELAMYKNALKTVCILLDDANNMVGCARSIALSPFGAEGKTVEDLRREFDEEIGA
jgi:hypothetical protein